ncbi:ThiF family adenylyltransferase [Fictibacillus sp. B-59209]|uniref:ThiF family adenylyltransferase n=1 Tax=Fictibacillus sp. B-59209 TaxID=3024873 RepID=UPI002E23CD49|nr:ThiF family adenylyltransferase [Fictibacillus sp. B-59209]
MRIPFKDLQSDIEEIEQNLLLSMRLLNDVNLDDYPFCDTVAEIEVLVCGEPAVFTIGFPTLFPHTLPLFFDKGNVFGTIPHKTSDGFLCYTRSDSVIIDSRYPGSLLLVCLKKVVQVIEAGLKKENTDEFSVEFEAYWKEKHNLAVFAYVDTTNTRARELDLWYKETQAKDPVVICAEKGDNVESAIQQLFHIDVKDAKKFRCIYLPLKERSFLSPPDPDNRWDFTVFKQNLVKNLTDTNRKAYTKLIQKPVADVKPGLEFVISGLPLENGNVALFGGTMSGNTIVTKALAQPKNQRIQVHPFVWKPKNSEFLRATIKRWHPNHLLNRTGGQMELTDKHILIAGVGSVGSEVATRLAKAGIGKLTLVDWDVMEVDNIHRHSLGADQVYTFNEKEGLLNKPKVWGLKEELNRKYPFTDIVMKGRSFLNILEEVDLMQHDIDLLIVAIGSPNTEMLINQTLHQLENPPPTLYTWVEPLGIGGHTLVTLNQDREGCYQCLFQPDDEGESIKNQSAFAEAGQEFAKSITGCGSVFTPYSFLDSERSAMLTVETAIKTLMGELSGNPILSWKGDDRLFKQGGFITRKRYSFSSKKLDETKYMYKDDRCPVCSEEGRDIHPNPEREGSL